MGKASVEIRDWFFEECGNYDKAFELIKGYGFDGIDYQALSVPKGFYMTAPEKEIEKKLTAIRKAAESSGTEICQTHALWFGDDSTREKREANLKNYTNNIYQTAMLGCKHLVIHPIMPRGWEKPEEKEQLEVNVAEFTELLEHAKKAGVILCVENLPFLGYPFNDMPDIKKFVTLMNHENIAICLDTGHTNCVRRKIAEDIKIAGSDLKATHVHDNNGYSDEHKFPYLATLDWESFYSAMNEIGYKGYLSFEIPLWRGAPDCVREELRRAFGKLARYMASRING